MLGAHYLLPTQAITTIDDFYLAGGGEGIASARRLGPSGTVKQVIASGLRGRGGGGFPTGAKWASVRSGGGRHYAAANGAEGEPATFKDRMLMRRDPYRVIEGAAIAAYAVGATEVYIATKASYVAEVAALRRAAVELSGAGMLGDLSVALVEGPDEYLFGEEKALLEVIEGRDPLPRLLPPWQHGLFATAPSGGWEAETVSNRGDSNPTVVNNVETLATVAHVLANGADWFRTMGTSGSPGTILATVVGAVQRPGVYEVEMGTPFSTLLDACGGPPAGRSWRAALSGVSNAVLQTADFDVPLTYEDLAARGSGLGAAGFVLYDDTVDMLSVAREFSRFLAIESCGQCPSCKEGCMQITDRLLAIESDVGTDSDLGEVEAWLRRVTDANRCYLGTQEQVVVSSILRAFPEDVAARLEGTAAPLRQVLVPLIKDITDDGVIVYDERHTHKRPDWSYD
jgi:NADH-quinone oxidoreductase subunit F